MALIDKIYHLHLSYIVILMVFGTLFYAVFSQVLNKKFWKVFNTVALFGSVFAILTATVLNREIGSISQLILKPFWTISEAKALEEYYRLLLMNCFAFFPLGLSLPFALPKKFKHKVLFTVAMGLLLSVLIEALQYIFSLGTAETDDVLCNTLGTFLGTLSFIITKIFQRRKEHGKS